MIDDSVKDVREQQYRRATKQDGSVAKAITVPSLFHTVVY